MTGFISPNHTQVPNDLFDILMAGMGNAELRVVLVAVRQTLGYHRASDSISLSQFVKMTGLSRQGVIDGLDAAIERGLIEELPKRGKRNVKRYKLVISDVTETSQDTGLVKPVDQSSELTSTSQASRPVGRATSQASRHTKERKTPKKPTKERSDPARPEMSPESSGDIPFTPSNPKKAYEDVEYGTRWGIINAWCSNLRAQPVGAFKRDENHDTAADIHRAGYNEDQVARYVTATQQDKFWEGKTLTLQKVAQLMPGWLASQSADASIPKLLPPLAPITPEPAAPAAPRVPIPTAEEMRARMRAHQQEKQP